MEEIRHIDQLKNYMDVNVLKCRCGCGMDVKDHIKWLLLSQIEFMERDYKIVGYSPIINCGARCPEHNASKWVKGSSNSAHMIGEAVDQGFKTYKEMDRIWAFLHMLKEKRKKIYLTRHFIHWDTAFGKPVPFPTDYLKVYPEYFDIAA